MVQPYFEVSLQLCAGGKEGVGESPTSGATKRPTLGWIVLVEFTLSILLPILFSLSSYFVLSSEIPAFRPMELVSSISSLSLQITIADRSWSNFSRNSRIALYRILNLIKRWLLFSSCRIKIVYNTNFNTNYCTIVERHAFDKPEYHCWLWQDDGELRIDAIVATDWKVRTILKPHPRPFHISCRSRILIFSAVFP